MDFGTNLTPIEVIKEGSFGGTYFRDIYSLVNDRWYKNGWKEFKELKKILIVSIIAHIIIMSAGINMVLNVVHH